MTDTLKSLRITKGLTQKSLAEKLGVSPVTVFQWERGIYHPTPSIVPKLADVLGITPNHLFLVLNTNKPYKSKDKI